MILLVFDLEVRTVRFSVHRQKQRKTLGPGATWPNARHAYLNTLINLPYVSFY